GHFFKNDVVHNVASNQNRAYPRDHKRREKGHQKFRLEFHALLPTAFSTVCRKWPRSNGLITTSNAPSFMARTAVSTVPKPVITMTSMRGHSFLILSSTFMPSA